ncbi:MAG: CHAD domain-containing protein [Saprospiraceae bacterium]|nr:CHAD domain-containing protein [Saprospiraceae bacterium]
MKKNRLNNYVIELTESLEQNLSSYTKEQKPEYLHQLRLDIKKIRAVFSFASKIYKEKFETRSLKPLFQKAGNIREIHINIDLLMEYPDSPDGLIPILKEKENILVQKFLENDSLNHKLINDFSEQFSLPEKLPRKKKIKKYFDKEQKKANKMFDNIDSDGLHEYRIKIKKILFAYRALPEKMQNKIELNAAKLSKEQKKLGKWHDTYAAVEFYSHEDFSRKAPGYISDLKEMKKGNLILCLKVCQSVGKLVNKIALIIHNLKKILF